MEIPQEEEDDHRSTSLTHQEQVELPHNGNDDRRPNTDRLITTSYQPSLDQQPNTNRPITTSYWPSPDYQRPNTNHPITNSNRPTTIDRPTTDCNRPNGADCNQPIKIDWPQPDSNWPTVDRHWPTDPDCPNMLDWLKNVFNNPKITDRPHTSPDKWRKMQGPTNEFLPCSLTIINWPSTDDQI